jgi:hypothetical protein
MEFFIYVLLLVYVTIPRFHVAQMIGTIGCSVRSLLRTPHYTVWGQFKAMFR